MEKRSNELNDNMLFPDGVKFYPDVQNGVRGYNTDAARGADTFHPFSQLLKMMYSPGGAIKKLSEKYTLPVDGTYTIFVHTAANGGSSLHSVTCTGGKITKNTLASHSVSGYTYLYEKFVLTAAKDDVVTINAPSNVEGNGTCFIFAGDIKL